MGTSRDKLLALRKENMEKISEEKPSDNFTNDVIKNLENSQYDNTNEQEVHLSYITNQNESPNRNIKEPKSEVDSGRYKLVGKKKESKRNRRGFVMTDRAFENIKRYSEENGYPSINDFVNDLFEHLYEIM